MSNFHKDRPPTHLAGDSVEEGVNNALGEPALLVFVHLDDLTPISCDLGQMQALAEIHKVENVFLEAAATKADGGTEELGSNTRVAPDRVSHLVDVGASRFTDSGERVDRGDPLSKG